MHPTGLYQPNQKGNFRLKWRNKAAPKEVKRRPSMSLGTSDPVTARLIAIAVKRALYIAGYCSAGITMPRGRPKKSEQ